MILWTQILFIYINVNLINSNLIFLLFI